jgi:hypothetical protein
MIVDLPRRWRWVIGVATGVVIALGVMFVVATRPPGDALIARAVAVVRSQNGPFAGEVEAAVQAPLPSVEQSHGDDEVEVCGGGWAKMGSDGSVDDAELARITKRGETRAQIVANLRADPSEFRRATAIMLTMSEALAVHRASLGDGAACAREGTNCEINPSMSAQPIKEWADGRDAVARMASMTADPHVYALAYKLCAGAAWGACQMIDARRWAQLDPENATPWMHILSEAVAHGDTGTQEEALHRIAMAQRSDEFYGDTGGAIIDAAPDDEAALPTVVGMFLETAGIEAAAVSAMQGVVTSCKGDALRDSNRAQTCTAIAEVLGERSATMLDQRIGVRIGRNVGWPADRVDLADGQFRAFISKAATFWMDGDHPAYGCASLRRGIDRIRRTATVGETGVLREWVAESGKTPQQFIDDQRAFLTAGAASAATGAASTP